MIVNSSQNIQSNNPLGSSTSRRIDASSRTNNVESEDNDKTAEKEAAKIQMQQDEAMLRRLRARDREVRAHEGAHVAAGGSLVRGGPSYTLQKGPDGRSYAIGGEVQLDVSPVADDPSATLIKAGRIRNAALAPAEPSPQDRRVASNANQLASRARVDIAILRREENKIEENEAVVSEASAETDVENAEVADTADVPNTQTSDAGPVSLKSNDVPAAAISAFMATAQTEASPIILSRFI